MRLNKSRLNSTVGFKKNRIILIAEQFFPAKASDPPTDSDLRNYAQAEDLARKLLLSAKKAGADYTYYLEGGDEIIPVLDVRKNVVGAHIGDLEVLRGRDDNDKPLLRNKYTKRRFKGSGRFGPSYGVKTEDALVLPVDKPNALLNKPQDFRQTLSYREAFEQLFPAGGDINDRGSLSWWFDQAWEAAEGSPQLVECPHPELHKEGARLSKKPIKHVVAFKKEANLIFKMIELAVGKAQSTVNVNVNEKKLVESLEHRVIDVRLQSLDVDGVHSRLKMIKDFGYLEGEFVDTTDGAHAPESVPEELAAPI